MKMRMMISAVLGVFVAASLVYLVAGGRGDRAVGDAGRAGEPAAASATAPHVVAYYFHGEQRCTTCLSIEANTADALRLGFPRELERGELAWRVVNVDDPANEHFVKDYALTTRTVVLVEMRDGAQVRWTALGDVWNLVDDPPAFHAYIQRETRTYLGG